MDMIEALEWSYEYVPKIDDENFRYLSVTKINVDGMYDLQLRIVYKSIPTIQASYRVDRYIGDMINNERFVLERLYHKAKEVFMGGN